MGDRIRADLEGLGKLRVSQAELLSRLETKIGAIEEAAGEVAGRVPGEAAARASGTEQEALRLKAREALDGLRDGARELRALLRFEEHACDEYREAEAEAAEILGELV